MQQIEENHKRMMRHKAANFGMSTRSYLVEEEGSSHHRVNTMDQPVQMQHLQVGPKSRSGPALFNVFSNGMDRANVKVDPLFETFMGPQAEGHFRQQQQQQQQQDADISSAFYGAL